MPPSTESTDEPPPAGIARHEQTAERRRRDREGERRAGDDREEHRGDQHLHHLLEALEAADQHQRAAGERMRDGAPRIAAPRRSVSVAMPRPEALVSAALTDTVQMTR